MTRWHLGVAEALAWPLCVCGCVCKPRVSRQVAGGPPVRWFVIYSSYNTPQTTQDRYTLCYRLLATGKVYVYSIGTVQYSIPTSQPASGRIVVTCIFRRPRRSCSWRWLAGGHCALMESSASRIRVRTASGVWSARDFRPVGRARSLLAKGVGYLFQQHASGHVQCTWKRKPNGGSG